MQQNGDDTRGTSAASGDAETRTRPGRSSVEDRQQAVLELLGGKATVDQVARRLGVKPETVKVSRAEALEGMCESLSLAGKSPQERTLEKENRQLREALTDASMRETILKRELEAARGARPTRPAKSRR